MKVLAIDDATETLDLICDILSAQGHDVQTADNGAAGLDKFVKFKPDLVTLDVAMPVMDGYETLGRILRLDKDASVIMLTAVENQQLLERCMQRGARGYLIKPFTEESLLAGVSNAFRAGANKNTVTMFSLGIDKMRDAAKRMLGDEADVILERIEICGKDATRSGSGLWTKDLSRARAVASPAKQVEHPKDSAAFMTEIGGQNDGMIASFVPEKDLQKSDYSDRVQLWTSLRMPIAAEFFNILHMKLLSEIANATHLMLFPNATIQINDTDSRLEQYSGKELTVLRLRIAIGKAMVIDVHTYIRFNLGSVFTRF